jgi:hypothetical protein
MKKFFYSYVRQQYYFDCCGAAKLPYLLPISSRQIDESISIADFFPPN